VDKHDVLVLQFHGRKRWQVLDRDAADDQTWPVLIDVEIEPGDVLYIPTGFPHGAETGSEASGHITIGIISVPWASMLRAAMTEAIAGIDGIDERLPPGFAHDPEALSPALAQRLTQIRSYLETVDPATIAATAAREFWMARDPVLTGQLGHMLDLDRIDDEWVVRRRPALICQLRIVDDRLFVLLGDRELDMPADLEGSVRRLVSGAAVPLSALRDDLDEVGRQVLVGRLIREGVLERVTAITG
jgi:hypothetical protein